MSIENKNTENAKNDIPVAMYFPPHLNRTAKPAMNDAMEKSVVTPEAFNSNLFSFLNMSVLCHSIICNDLSQQPIVDLTIYEWINHLRIPFNKKPESVFDSTKLTIVQSHLY